VRLTLACAALACAAAGVGGVRAPDAASALRPDSILTPPGGPTLIRLTAPGSGLTTLRLSVPLDETPSEAGAGQILVQLGLERARNAAASLGARVDGTRTAQGIAYTVVGATDDFDYLAYVLREAVAEPRADPIDFEHARMRVHEEADRLRETGAGRLSYELRTAAVPGSAPLSGTPESLDALTPDVVHDLWSRTHRRARMSLVVVGAEPLELVLAAFKDIGARGAAPEPPTAAAPRAKPTKVEVLRNWYGEAWALGDARDPRGELIAALIASRLRDQTGGDQMGVELWDVDTTRVLAITGTAYPTRALAMRRRVTGILPEIATKLGRDEVAPAVAALRFDLLAGARTPWGLAALVGRYYDATGEPDAAYRHLIALEAVDYASLESYLQDVQHKGAARAEIKP
jgi:hypothetical protein